MKKLCILPLVVAMLLTVGCTSLEKLAYNTVVGAKAFLDTQKQIHSECPTSGSPYCLKLRQATAAKDALIDAAEVYCSGPEFETGGACEPPKKGSAAYDQAVAKLKAAIAAYNQA